MARRARNGSNDSRDWMTRAKDDFAHAETLPAGPARDEAIRKAGQLRSAAEMMGYLHSEDLRAPK